MRLTGLSRLYPCEGERIKVRGFSASRAYPCITLPLPSTFRRERRPCEDVGAFCRLSNVSPVRSANTFGFTPSELRTLRALKTPAGIQKFLDDLPYNLGYTARSPKKVLHDRVASCKRGGLRKFIFE